MTTQRQFLKHGRSGAPGIHACIFTYRASEHAGAYMLELRDENYRGAVSLTNDVERVLACVQSENRGIPFFNLDNFYIVYRDSNGDYDGIVTEGNKFKNFLILGASTSEEAFEAIQKVITREAPPQKLRI